LGHAGGGKGVTQPASKVATAAIGSVQFLGESTLYLLMPGV
jgi:hypothetical protein